MLKTDDFEAYTGGIFSDSAESCDYVHTPQQTMQLLWLDGALTKHMGFIGYYVTRGALVGVRMDICVSQPTLHVSLV